MQDAFFLDLLKTTQVSVAEDIPETGFIDTGSYALNAVLSGSIYGGIPNNRVVMLAGAPSAGKSFLALACIKTYMDENPTASVLYFDTEFALERSMVAKRGIDVNRFHIVQTETLEDFRTKAVKILDAYEKSKKKLPMVFALDSLSNLATNKEVADAMTGHTARDMTKAQVIRSIFRILTNKLGKNNVPLIVTSHTYSSMDMYSPVVISGGAGHVYAASTVITLNKAKFKEGNEVIGNVIRATVYKSRYTKENKKVELKLDYNTGLDRYYGILPIAEKYGIIKKVSTRYELPNGDKVFGVRINADPEKYFTKDVLDKIDEACRKEFKLGEGSDDGNSVEISDEELENLANENTEE